MHFGKFESNFFTSRRGALLLDIGGCEAMALYFYLRLNHNASYTGVNFIDFRQACATLSLAKEKLVEYLLRFDAEDLVKYDAASQTVWVVHAAEMNIGELKEKDSQIIKAQREFDQIPKTSPLRAPFHAHYAAMLKLKDEVFAPAAAPAPVEVAAQVTTEQATALKYEGAVEVLIAARARGSNRAKFDAANDEVVAENAMAIFKKVGRTMGSALVATALEVGDLDMTAAMNKVFPGRHQDI